MGRTEDAVPLANWEGGVGGLGELSGHGISGQARPSLGAVLADAGTVTPNRNVPVGEMGSDGESVRETSPGSRRVGRSRNMGCWWAVRRCGGSLVVGGEASNSGVRRGWYQRQDLFRSIPVLLIRGALRIVASQCEGPATQSRSVLKRGDGGRLKGYSFAHRNAGALWY